MIAHTRQIFHAATTDDMDLNLPEESLLNPDTEKPTESLNEDKSDHEDESDGGSAGLYD